MYIRDAVQLRNTPIQISYVCANADDKVVVNIPKLYRK